MRKTLRQSVTIFALALTVFAASDAVKTVDATVLPAHDSPPDVEFLDMMMLHHEHGIAMARQAEQKATLPRVKEFAAKTAADQQQDMEKMREMRARLFPNVSKADKMRMGAKPMTTRQMNRMAQVHMQKLEAARGKAFDHVFLDTMKKHHEMALAMSRNEVEKGQQPEVKDMANATIEKQTREIGEMRDMMKQAGGTAAGSGSRKGGGHKH